jgi:hypothetical protein
LGLPSAQSPFAACRCDRHAEDVTRLLAQDITPTSSLLRAHAPNRCPPVALGSASGSRSLQVAVSPWCATALPDVISADPALRVWTSTQADPGVPVPVTSPETMTLPKWRPGRRNRNPPDSDFCQATNFGAAAICQGSDLQVCSPPRSLPPSRLATSGSRGFCVRASHGPFPRRAADMLTAQIRAIDGKGTHTPQDRQPCRLLPPPLV